MAKKNETKDMFVESQHETAKAFLVLCGEDLAHATEEIWLPKSQLAPGTVEEMEDNEGWSGNIEIPVWLLKEKGLA